jgi:hypothetical protein
MTTSDQLKLVETYSQKATDSKPIGTYTKKQLIELEHKWRLKLKKSGFEDIEMWDNKPLRKTKRLQFIKGHIRRHRYNMYRHHIPKTLDSGLKKTSELKDRNYDEMAFWRGYQQNADETFEYYRILGLYAHHCPKGEMPEKYRKLLQVYASCGYRNEAIRKVAPKVKPSAIEMYLMRNFHKMIEFVDKLEREEDDTRVRNPREN